MRIIDRFILKSFIRPFLVTFFVMVFFLLMQFVWKYIDDLVGRGVEWYYIAELLFYTSATMVPMALPLAVLLSSIMVLGTLGEHNELAALKSAGVSLIRVMRPLFVFVLLLAAGAFLFANYVIPVANLKSETLRRNITNKKPALSIRPGVFYKGIENYAIKVGDKYGKNQNLLRDVLIYDHSSNAGNLKVIASDSGQMFVTPDERYLEITLFNGHSYEDQIPKRSKERDNKPFVRSSFEKSLIRFSLSEFQSGDLRKSGRKEFDMLSVRQLSKQVDSLGIRYDEMMNDFVDQMKRKYNYAEWRTTPDNEEEIMARRRREYREQLAKEKKMAELADPAEEDSLNRSIARQLNDTILQNFAEERRARILQNAMRIARSNNAYFSNAGVQYGWRKEVITRHVLEWHKKFSLSFAVIVLFFIGAPLGAIIRKGGMGMPVVVSVVIFIIYHVMTISFEKLGRHMIWDPIPAMWAASMFLLPAGIWLTLKSASDSVIFNAELYLKPFQKLALLFSKKKKNPKNSARS
jgi:lipopolysaccharide export system permease protein